MARPLSSQVRGVKEKAWKVRMPANRVKKFDFDIGMGSAEDINQGRYILQDMFSGKEKQGKDSDLGGAGLNRLPDGRSQVRFGKG